MYDSTERAPLPSVPLSVVLAAYQVAGDVESLLGSWHAELVNSGRGFEILFVDEGSVDGTPEQAEALTSKYPELRILRPAEPIGIGAALRAGLAAARHPLFFYAECSTRFQPADLKQLLTHIDAVDLVTGFRVAAPPPLWLRILGSGYRLAVRVLFGLEIQPRTCWLGWKEYFYRLLAQWLFGLRIQDVACPFRLFRRQIFERIPIQSNQAFSHVEILAKANFLGCLMDEVPVAFHPTASRIVRDSETSLRRRLREGWQVLKNADFGPVHLPDS